MRTVFTVQNSSLIHATLNTLRCFSLGNIGLDKTSSNLFLRPGMYCVDVQTTQFIRPMFLDMLIKIRFQKVDQRPAVSMDNCDLVGVFAQVLMFDNKSYQCVQLSFVIGIPQS